MNPTFKLAGELEVRRLGFGAMRIVRDREEGVRVVRRAVELSATLIDTADISNCSLGQLRQAQSVTTIAAVQNEYNRGLLTSEDVLEACEAEGIAFVPWSPLGESLREPAYELRWLLDRSPVMLPIPGTSSVAHLEENMRAVA